MEQAIRVVQINENVKSNSVPNRIRIGLKNEGIRVSLLTAHSCVHEEEVVEVKGTFAYKVLRKIASLWKRTEYSFFYEREEGMPFSYDKVGMNLVKNAIVKDADIIELHWVCGSFLSVKGIKKLLKMGKPIVWICHDNWPFTGGCHVRLGCEKYKDACGRCPQLKSTIKKDWSYRLLKAKKKAIQNANLTIVSPSTWMDKNVVQSSLFSQCMHCVIPNPIDTDKYIPMKREVLRTKYHIEKEEIVILFGAVNAVSTPYKGYSYLLKAIEILEKELPDNIWVSALIFGTNYGDERENGRIKVRYMGYLSEERMVETYNMADVYVVPSLEDSFNSTVAESLACETPVVAFATGGIIDIIEHKENGYLAKYKDTEDLACGVKWVIENNRENRLGICGREKVLREYSVSVVAGRYADMYKRIG